MAPFSVAAIVAVPAPTPVTVAVALDAPAATVTGDCTVAMAGLLLVTVMLTALAAAAFSETVAWAVLPAAIVVALSVTPETEAVPLGAVDDFEHVVTAKARISVTINLMAALSPRLDLADHNLNVIDANLDLTDNKLDLTDNDLDLTDNDTVVLASVGRITTRYTGYDATRVH